MVGKNERRTLNVQVSEDSDIECPITPRREKTNINFRHFSVLSGLGIQAPVK